jgi:C4-type Zn-finger protein
MVKNRRKDMRYIIILLLCANIALAQTYEVPFSSKGNIIELSVANSSGLTAEGVKVEISNVPEGIKFTEKSVTLATLKGKEEQTASFKFSVEKTAVLNKDQTLTFTITDNTGQSWTKDIKIIVTPPLTYELFQNYPNPFGEAIPLG